MSEHEREDEDSERTTIPNRRHMPIAGRMVALEARLILLETQMAHLRPVVTALAVALIVILGALVISAWRYQHP